MSSDIRGHLAKIPQRLKSEHTKSQLTYSHCTVYTAVVVWNLRGLSKDELMDVLRYIYLLPSLAARSD